MTDKAPAPAVRSHGMGRTVVPRGRLSRTKAEQQRRDPVSGRPIDELAADQAAHRQAMYDRLNARSSA